MDWRLLFLPVVSALIGWFTNVLAVRMMFRPRKPISLPLLPLTIQGLLPKRHAEIARVIGETIERELVSIESLIEEIDIKSYQQDVVEAVVSHVDKRLTKILPTFIPANIRAVITQMVEDLIRKESVLLMEGVVDKVTEKVTSEISLAKMVEERILAFDLGKLEGVVLGVASRELKHIEILGAVLGFIIGLGQVGLLLILD